MAQVKQQFTLNDQAYIIDGITPAGYYTTKNEKGNLRLFSQDFVENIWNNEKKSQTIWAKMLTIFKPKSQ